ncbi:MAG: hypothetical protein EP333_05145 [Bacteroidetes bacterium]|nr:MAG: hypothetical protein EP333_05145 [Bacteroidota bacterium]
MIPVFPTSYFGSIAYFRAIVKYSTIALEAKEHFPKQSLRNRTRINTANGLIDLSVPVLKPFGSKSPTDTIRMDDSKDWRANHWKSLSTAYQSAPFFEHYESDIKDLIFSDIENLLEFNTHITKAILSLIDIEINFQFTTEFELSRFKENEAIVHKHFGNQSERAPYIQVFNEADSYTPSLSILDTIFCEGPLARNLIVS